VRARLTWHEAVGVIRQGRELDSFGAQEYELAVTGTRWSLARWCQAMRCTRRMADLRDGKTSLISVCDKGGTRRRRGDRTHPTPGYRHMQCRGRASARICWRRLLVRQKKWRTLAPKKRA